jgi:hypothetical protein
MISSPQAMQYPAGGGHIHLYKYYDDDKFHDDNNILIVTITMMENRRIMVTIMLAVR